MRQALCAEGGDCAGDFRRGIVTLQDELEALAETIAVQNADGIEYLVDTLLIAGAAKADEPAPLCRIGRPRRAVGFLEDAGLRRANPLLYRCFPLTCARSQE